MATVIIGSGIIGLSTAYYLLNDSPGSSIHIVDPSPTLFTSSSGRAAGFLARDWHRASVAPLARLSFDLHRHLALTEGGAAKWGYDGATSLRYTLPSEAEAAEEKGNGDDWLREGTSRAGEARARRMLGEGPRWLRRKGGDEVEIVDGGTAIVDPLRLCEWLLERCREGGVTIHHPARVACVNTQDGQVSGVRIRGDEGEVDVEATRILVSAGAWTADVFQGLFADATVRIPMGSLAGHSLVLKYDRDDEKEGEEGEEGEHAVFCVADGYAPEIFSRKDSSGRIIYVAGLNATLPLPRPDAPTPPIPSDMDRLKDAAERFLNLRSEPEILREALCFRPVTSLGHPLICRLPDERLGVKTKPGGGVFIAAGHGPWGICLSLGTGRVVADLIIGRTPSADISLLSVP